MKKILLTFVSLLMAFNVLADNDNSAPESRFKQDEQYTVLSNQATEKPQVIEFFSFYCGACFQFDQGYQISQKIKDSLPENVEYHKYHASFMGGEMGMILTQAWAVAIVMKVEDKVKPIIFEGVQKTRSINSQKDVRDAFIKAGVSGEEFDSMWDNFIVKSLLSKQLKEAQDMQLNGVPAVYINGKYLIKLDGMNSLDDFVDVTKYLALEKK